jgi:hypothetical protein
METRPEGERLRVVLSADILTPSGELLEHQRPLVTALVAYGRGDLQQGADTLANTEERRISYRYLDRWDDEPRSRRVYHGPSFRGLEEVILGHQGCHRARLRVCPAEALRPWRSRAGWWLPAVVLDSCLVACKVIAQEELGIAGLPGGFAEVRSGRAPRPGERCEAEIRLMEHPDREIRFDITAFGEDGRILVAVKGYSIRTFS